MTSLLYPKNGTPKVKINNNAEARLRFFRNFMEF